MEYNNNYNQQNQFNPYGTPTPPQPPQKKARTKVAIWVLVLCIVLASIIGGITGALVSGFVGGFGSDEKKDDGNIGSSIKSALVDEESFTSTDGTDDTISSIMASTVCISTVHQTESFFGTQESQGAGSGVIISSDGYIITCAHVVSGASVVGVLTADEKEYEAKVVGYSTSNDIALLKINAKDLPAVKLGASSKNSVGDKVYAVGNPLGNFVISVSQGIISGLDRQVNISQDTTMKLVQVDAAINPGNSGGGLFNEDGELIGIVNAKNTGIDVEGMGFAIPIDTAMGVIEKIEEKANIKIDK